jgi:hypothetical protein
MTTIPETCTPALAAIEANPLDLPSEVLDHLRTCQACAEARVLWLAQEPSTPPLTPAGYFEALPRRVLRLLPPARRPLATRPALWAAAAILTLAAGVGGFMAGRVNSAPVVEASRIPEESVEAAPDTPFRDSDEDLNQLLSLTPEETQALLRHLKANPKAK